MLAIQGDAPYASPFEWADDQGGAPAARIHVESPGRFVRWVEVSAWITPAPCEQRSCIRLGPELAGAAGTASTTGIPTPLRTSHWLPGCTSVLRSCPYNCRANMPQRRLL